MRPDRHLIFDFDGVLCDSLAAAIETFNDLGRGEFPSLPAVAGQEDMVKVFGGSLRSCLSSWLDEEEHRRFFDLHSKMMASRADELCLFDGVAEMFEELPDRGASVVTSAYSEAVRRVLLRKDGSIPPALHEIVGRESRQTKAEKLLGLMRRLGLHSRDCLYVGDLESDILYCREVPVDIVAVSYGYHPRWHLERLDPTYLVHSVAELRELLRHALGATALPTTPATMAGRTP